MHTHNVFVRCVCVWMTYMILICEYENTHIHAQAFDIHIDDLEYDFDAIALKCDLAVDDDITYASIQYLLYQLNYRREAVTHTEYNPHTHIQPHTDTYTNDTHTDRYTHIPYRRVDKRMLFGAHTHTYTRKPTQPHTQTSKTTLPKILISQELMRIAHYHAQDLAHVYTHEDEGMCESHTLLDWAPQTYIQNGPLWTQCCEEEENNCIAKITHIIEPQINHTHIREIVIRADHEWYDMYDVVRAMVNHMMKYSYLWTFVTNTHENFRVKAVGVSVSYTVAVFLYTFDDVGITPCQI